MSKLKLASLLFLISTVILKFSSMIRDLLIAHLFGASYVSDAYLAALVIPNAIILFLMTGMKDAFLPSYIKYETKGDGLSHLTNIVKGTFWICLVIGLIGSVISPIIIPMLYPDFNAEGLQIATWTAIIYFASVVFVGINAVYEGYFDAKRRFAFSTFSQTIVVFSTIIGALVFHRSLGIYSLPLGYFVGTILSLAVKFLVMGSKRFLNWKQKLSVHEVRAFYLIFIPVGLTTMVGQVNLLVNTMFATRLGEGVASYLNYAFRLVSIPQAIFGVTIATIVFPLLSQAKATDNIAQFRRGIEKGLAMMFLLLAPTLAGMVLLMEEFTKAVYERGAFDAIATQATSEVGIFYIGSVMFYSIQAVVAKGFYTLEKGHYMLRIGIVSIVLNAIFNYIFSQLIGYQGLALSSSVVALIYSTLTFTILYKMIGGFKLSYIGKEFAKSIIATVAMLVALIGAEALFHFSAWNVYLYLILMVMIGAAVYFAAIYLLRSESFFDIVARTKRRKNA